MSSLPLLAHPSADGIVAWRGERPVSLQQFLAEVHQLTALFPAGKHLLNMCSDRYRFSVGLAAAIVTGKVSLLPSTHTPETIRQIKLFAPDVFCLTDSDLCTVDLPQLRYPDSALRTAEALPIPQIEASQRIAVVFTSGSTGIPQPHPKTWGALVGSVQAEALRLELLQDPRCTLIGTVPPQHMYGFESTVLMAWQSGNALSHAQPFYPADICQALAAVPTPRVLVSSPVHLRALLDAGLPLPELALVMSATAPLSTELAREVETRCEAPLLEIYGSTETGLIATRRTAHTPQWQLLPGITWAIDGESLRACGGHIETLTAMSDKIEPLDETHFLLHGRIADMINIAGKRHSLASLNHLLTTLPGVIDGAFFMPDENDQDHITRLAACVVAPDMDAAHLLAALREHLDPVFLPRPLLFVKSLPRNGTGKLPRAALQALFETPRARKSA
jgi:acyl-coenzyme A synthetase/AMP-(fatty) acid ligase